VSADGLEAEFHQTNLQGADFSGAAQLQGADFSDAVGLTRQQIEAALVDERTLLPEEVRPQSLTPRSAPTGPQ
jgi:uncharacterized protein YjbI with pentapeptide repeats